MRHATPAGEGLIAVAGSEASMELGRLIRARREDAGMLRVEFAEWVGWAPALQSRIERGVRPLRNDAEVYMVAKALGMEPEELRMAMGVLRPFDGEQPTNARLLHEVRELRALVERVAVAVLPDDGKGQTR